MTERKFEGAPAPLAPQDQKLSPTGAARRAQRQSLITGPGPEAAAEMLCVLKDATVDLLRAVQESMALTREVLEEVSGGRRELAKSSQALADAVEVMRENTETLEAKLDKIGTN